MMMGGADRGVVEWSALGEGDVCFSVFFVQRKEGVITHVP